jgi:hypothetical protein
MRKPFPRSLLFGGCCLALNLASLAAPPPDPRGLRAVYERELAVCRDGRSNQSRETCLTEAHNAHAAARRGGLSSANAAQLASNALRRCEPLPEQQRSACVARMQGQGRVSGSVAAGGISRELLIRDPEAAASAAPRP